MRTVGGEIGAASSLAPKIGPLGLVGVACAGLLVARSCCLVGAVAAGDVLRTQSPKKIGEDMQKATMDWKGLKVTVRLTVINRVATVLRSDCGVPLL